MSDYCIWKSFDFQGDAAHLFYLLKDEPYVFFLDSNLMHHERGRYSFIGFDPFDICTSKNKNSLEELRKLFLKYKFPSEHDPSPLRAGMVGFFGYDFGLRLEDIKLMAIDDLHLPDCFFGLYDCIITIDHLRHKLIISSTGLPEENNLLRQTRAKERSDNIIKKLSNNDSLNITNIARCDEAMGEDEILECCSSNFTKAQYIRTVSRALKYIEAGDIYQVNLSQRFRFNAEPFWDDLNPVQIYLTLRTISPSSFGGYFNAGKFQILSSSPERFLWQKDGNVETRPMKGTRARGRTVYEDQKLRHELLHSIKDKAELLMITDLERNDLGRVCRFGSVKVKENRSLEEYSTVFHTTSLIEGTLQNEKDAFDLIRACFPGGSITGCPKIRSMEIIEELETLRRGVYTGSLGFISFGGNMDFNILIRTLLIKNKEIFFHVGGGIVSDSLPEIEYQESLIKAQGMLRTLAQTLKSGAGV